MTGSWNYDCLVVGGGPAGLTAALYLARFRRSVLVIDAGKSRAVGIPRSHNHPGFIHGISGPDLLHALRIQAEGHGAVAKSGTVLSLQAEAHGFTVDTTIGSVKTLRVLIATGITDKCPELDVMDSADVKQAVRYCPICDGFEAINKKIAVYGSLDGAGGKAQFLRIYSPFVTLLPTTLNDKGNQPTSTEFAVASSPPEKILARDGGVDVVLVDRI